jgi:hypothetical protein
MRNKNAVIWLSIVTIALAAIAGGLLFIDNYCPMLIIRWNPWPSSVILTMARVSEEQSHQATASDSEVAELIGALSKAAVRARRLLLDIQVWEALLARLV